MTPVCMNSARAVSNKDLQLNKYALSVILEPAVATMWVYKHIFEPGRVTEDACKILCISQVAQAFRSLTAVEIVKSRSRSL